MGRAFLHSITRKKVFNLVVSRRQIGWLVVVCCRPFVNVIQGSVNSINLSQRRVFYFFFYEIFVDSTLAARRIGEQKFSCLQFASSADNVASEVIETICVFVQIQYWYDWYGSCILFFYSRINKSKRHASCLFIKVTVDRVPWQRSFSEISVRESCLFTYRRILPISRVAKSKRHASGLWESVKSDVRGVPLRPMKLGVNESTCAVWWCKLHDFTVVNFDALSACDRQTDRHAANKAAVNSVNRELFIHGVLMWLMVGLLLTVN